MKKSMRKPGDKRYGPKPRKNFCRSGGVKCKDCFERDLVIEELREELKRTKQKLQFLEKKNKRVKKSDLKIESHKPSSKFDYKKNATPENQKKQGGAKPGHKGHGRKSSSKNEVFEEVSMPDLCPCCNEKLIIKDVKDRTLVEMEVIKAKRSHLKLKRGQCPKCRKVYQPKVNALPKALYGNQLLSHAAVMHYVHGVPIGRLLQILGPEVTEGGLINAFHKIGELCSSARERLIEEYRNSKVRHADETGWRTNGCSGYAWIFNTERLTIFDLRDTRASRVPKEILGENFLEGYLVVDRYPGYNKMPVKLQYCYAHLLREVESLEKEFGGDKEVEMFTNRMSGLLADAMRLRQSVLTDDNKLSLARDIKKKIKREVNVPYLHLGIKRVQQIFLDNSQRMYHWANDPTVPAENNRAERDLRPTVIARKSSFGSQSKLGAQTRSNIMSVLLTVQKRIKNQPVENWLYKSLNDISNNKSINFGELIPP